MRANQLATPLRVAFVLALGVTLRHAHAQTVPPPDAIRTVALSGQQAPGMPGGTNLQNLAPDRHYPVFLNNAGHVTFLADTNVESGIWSDRSGQLSLVASTGNAAPGARIGETFHRFWTLGMDEAGRISFGAQLTGPNTDQWNERGIWSEGPGGLALIARDLDFAPGTPSFVRYQLLSFPSLMRSSAGRTVFYSDLSRFNQGVGSGIWSEEAGIVTPVARAGHRAPGTPDGVVFHLVGGGDGKAINDVGRVAFIATLQGPGVSHFMGEGNGSGIWSEGTGSLALVARRGSQAPGMPSGLNFLDFHRPAFNNEGHVAFSATLYGSGVSPAAVSGLWSNMSGSLELVARGGSRAPGTPAGVNFSTFFNRPSLNNAGQIAVLTDVSGSGVDATNDRGIWFGHPTDLKLIARSGSPAPGTASGVNFSGFYEPALNDAGQIAFRGSLIGSGVDRANDVGIWATDPTDTLQLIARTGGVLEVGTDDFRTINDLSMMLRHGSSDGQPSGFNDSGHIAFWARFTDGSEGIFVSSLVAVPEPSGIVLLGLTLSALLRRARGDKRVPLERV